MKKIILILFLFSGFVKAQNLVFNGNFESFNSCPSLGHVHYANGWRNAGADPDFMFACGGPGAVIPNTAYNYQYAHSGLGMASLANFVRGPSYSYVRENITSKLIDTLKVGQKYFVSFYANFGCFLPGYQKIATDKLGALFSKTLFDSTANRPKLNNFAHVYTNTIITDTVNWVKISGSFIADSAYRYIVIGNFFTANNVDSLLIGSGGNPNTASYYYIDDVCVSKDSLTCNSFVGIEEINSKNNDFTIYPNPNNGLFQIEILNDQFIREETELKIVTVLGEEVKREKLLSSKQQLDISELNNGIYFLQLVQQNKVVLSKKVVKQ